MKITRIPFMGLYYTPLDDGLNSEIELQASGMSERDVEREDEIDRLCEREYQELLCDHATWSLAHVELCKEYTQTLVCLVEEESGFDLGLQFESMASPREYNFETDRIFCCIPEATLDDLLARVDKVVLAQVVKEQFTSRSGFSSYYSGDVREWLEEPLSSWDHNQTCALIEAFLIQTLGESWEENVVQRMVDKSLFTSAFEAAIDWAELDADVERRRNKRRAVAGMSPRIERCSHTPDMFK